jgi:hypothetical protein
MIINKIRVCLKRKKASGKAATLSPLTSSA